jgi:RNA polymerase sigma-70 factor (ECF subfamily)
VRTYRRPDAWLYRVATNLALSYLRRKQMLSFSQLAPRGQGDGEEDDWTPAETAADPLDVETQTAQRDLIVRALAGLPDRYRTVLLLRAVYDWSWEEIAAALGTTTGNARQLLSRARQRFCLLYEAA